MAEPKPEKAKGESKPSPWEQFVNALSPAARQAVQHKEPPKLKQTKPVADEPQLDYAEFRDSLTEESRNVLDDAPAEETTTDEVELLTHDDAEVRYGLVEDPDGEWPKMRLFKTPEGLARRIGEQEGKDMVVLTFYGVPLHLTKGPQRYLSLPDGVNSISIPLTPDMPPVIVANNMVEHLAIETEGYLGPPELAESSMPEKPQPKKSSPVHNEAPDDEDDDEDDDEEDVAP